MKLRQVGAVLAAASIVLAACGDDDDDDASSSATAEPQAPATTAAGTEAPATTAAPAARRRPPPRPHRGSEAPYSTAEATGTQPAEGQMMIQPGTCGLNNGEEATGDPIKLGALATNIPAADFTWIPAMAAIYFDCVNANGGIYGHPIDYHYEDETEIDPALSASLATKLVEEDQVVGIVGSTVADRVRRERRVLRRARVLPDHRRRRPGLLHQPATSRPSTWARTTRASAAPRLRSAPAPPARSSSPRRTSPGFDLINSGVVEFAEGQGLKGVSILETAPIADPAGFRPAARAGGRRGRRRRARLHRSRRAPGARGDRAAGSDRLGHLGQLDAAQRPHRRRGPERCVGRQVPDQRRVQPARLGRARRRPHAAAPRRDASPTSRSRRSPRWATSPPRPPPRRCCGWARAPSTRRRPSTRRSAHSPDMESDMLCKPWYFSSGLPEGNVSNNTDYTVVAGRRPHGPARGLLRDRGAADQPARCHPCRRSGDVADRAHHIASSDGSGFAGRPADPLLLYARTLTTLMARMRTGAVHA